MEDWRSKTVDSVRHLIHEAVPDVVEEIKWVKQSNPGGVPTFSRSGLVCTVETYKDKVKVTFAKGATLPDPAGLFNSSLDGATRRAIDIQQDDMVNETAFVELIQSAVALNES